MSDNYAEGILHECAVDYLANQKINKNHKKYSIEYKPWTWTSLFYILLQFLSQILHKRPSL